MYIFLMRLNIIAKKDCFEVLKKDEIKIYSDLSGSIFS